MAATLLVFLLGVSTVMASSSTPEMSFFYKFRTSLQGHSAMDNSRFSNMWMSWNTDGNQEISKAEFVQGWTNAHLSNAAHAALFFLEVDMDNNLVIDQSDLSKLFRMFDFNEDNFVEDIEFRDGWQALFTDLIQHHHQGSSGSSNNHNHGDGNGDGDSDGD